jgi:N-acetylglucosaminyldiphosphoundecaprenol N-acetyl-beta-D-mannosaminyltransferase
LLPKLIGVTQFLFVALGFPKQEQWLAKNIDKLSVNVFQDVGGSFDVLSGHVKRAPQFYIDHHLEWLYRSLSNPARIGRIFQLPFFIVKSLWWKLKGGNK